MWRETVLPKKIRTELTGKGGAQKEQGLACALAWMEKIEKMPGFDPNDGVKRQVVVATDEPDCNPRILFLLQSTAERMNISVKVQYSFAKGAVNYGGKGDSYVIVDIKKTDAKEVNNQGKFCIDRQQQSQLDWYLAALGQGSPVNQW
jgi:hypothetical protein